MMMMHEDDRVEFRVLGIREADGWTHADHTYLYSGMIEQSHGRQSRHRWADAQIYGNIGRNMERRIA